MSGHRGGKQHQQSRQRRGPTVVFFDLETTGFDRPIRPVQVLKVLDESEGIYNTYVIHAFSNMKQPNLV